MIKTLCLLIAALLIALPVSAANAPLTVNSANDANDGTCDVAHCSLREAINRANTQAGLDTIAFSITGAAPHTIQPTTPLPWITQPVTIDGTTEPDYVDTPVIVLNGAFVSALPIQAELKVGLNTIAGGTTIRGLVINGFAYGAIGMLNLGGNRIEDNWIGLSADGASAVPNLYGVIIVESPNNRVWNNVISGNNDDGVNIYGTAASGNSVLSNQIGVSVDDNPLGNADDGVKIELSPNNEVAYNEIAYNSGNGVIIRSASRNRVSANRIYQNGLLGIALEQNANGSIAAPTIESAWRDVSMNAVVQISGRASTTYRVELFTDEACDAFGAEGPFNAAVYSVTTNASGQGIVEINTALAPIGTFATATLTDSSGNTSAFSACAPVTTDASDLAVPRLNIYPTTDVAVGWSIVTWADHYQVQYAPYPEAFSEGFVFTTRELQYTFSGLFDGDWFWRVRGVRENGSPGPWSTLQRFVVDVP